MQKNELTTPLQKVMGGLRRENSAGYWTLRNLGSLRDAMQPLDVERQLNIRPSTLQNWKLVPSTDYNVPNCPYCADLSFWRDTYYVGSFGQRTGKCEGFPDPNQCYKYPCNIFALTQTSFTLVPIGTANCYDSAVISPLMGNDVYFASETMCWASANAECSVSTTSGAIVGSVFWNARAFSMLILAVALGVVSGGIGVYFFTVTAQSLIRSSILQYIVKDKAALALVQETFLLASSFALLRRPKPDSTNSDAEDEEEWLPTCKAVDVDETWPNVADEIFPAYLSLNQRVEFGSISGLHLRQRLGRFLGQEHTVSYSAMFLRNFLGTNLNRERPVVSRDLASFWLIQACSWLLQLPTGQNGNLSDDDLKCWCKIGHPPLQAVNGAKYDYSLVCLSELEWTGLQSGEGYRVKINMWDEEVDGPDEEVDGPVKKTSQKLFEDLQEKAEQLRYLLQRLHLHVTLWFILDRSVKEITLSGTGPPGKDASSDGTPAIGPAAKPEAAYARIAEALNKDTKHTLVGEIQAVLAQALIILLPCGLLLLLTMTQYYTVMKEKGVQAQGRGGSLDQIQVSVGRFFVIFLMSVSSSL